ncbi:MAG: FAD:protein FMN transferase [Synechococcaceae cyanobacterium]|nr:FAD:protein FMN transferase [Synechococcaceae cyanobacterium]
MVVRLATDAMGTRFEVVLDGEDPHRLRPVGEAALAEIEEWHDRLSRFDAGSFVAHLNARAGREPVPLDADMFELLSACAAVHDASEGAFDVTVGTGPLMLDGRSRTVRFAGDGTAIDLGGIGKGHALDRAAAVLREHGVARALLHGGTSSVVAIGGPPGAAAWRVALRLDHGAAVAHLRDAALSVSGAHERDGEPLAHVVDPRIAAPAPLARVAAVVGPSAREADAWSTALLVLGRRPAAIPDHLATLITRQGEAGPHLDRHDRDGAAFTIDQPRAAALETAR